MNEIFITLIITIGLVCYSFLVGLVCFYWGRYNGYLTRVKDEKKINIIEPKKNLKNIRKNL